MALRDPNSRPEDRRPYRQNKNKRIQLLITEETDRAIRERAKAQGKSITEYIVSLVEKDQ